MKNMRVGVPASQATVKCCKNSFYTFLFRYKNRISRVALKVMTKVHGFCLNK